MGSRIGNTIRGLVGQGNALGQNGLWTIISGGNTPFNPIDLNPLIYLDANVGVTESAGLVSAWADQSGNNNDFTQVTGSLQPEYQATGLNSLPSIYFNGTDEMISATLSSAFQEMSFYAVFVQTSPTATGPSIIGQTSGTNNKRIFTTPPDAASRVFLWDGGVVDSIVATSTTYNYSNPIVLAFRENTDASGDGRINDDAWSTGELVTSATSSDLPIKLGNRGSGTARRLVGNISELIIYPTIHTDSEANQVITYLTTKWDVGAVPAPQVDSVDVSTINQGTTAEIIITGSYLTGATIVSFGAQLTTDSYVVDSDTQITAQVTAGVDATPAQYNISVTTPNGTGTLINGIEILFAFSNALSFDGVNDKLNIGTPVSLSAEATINLWVNFTSFTNNRLISDNVNTGVIWFPTTTSVRVYCGGNNRDFVVPTMSLGTWYMITATRDATDGWRVYLNGTESTSGLQARAGTFIADRFGNLGSAYSNMVLDEASILEGTTASDTQIASLYNSGNGADANAVLGSTSLYYRLNGSGTETTATDSSGNSNTGTLVNFTGTYWVAH